MPTHRFQIQSGQNPRALSLTGRHLGAPLEGEECALLLCDKPDTVHLPLALGGGEVRCDVVLQERCACGGDHLGRVYYLDSPFRVCDCPARKEFLWYRPRTAAEVTE
jgi:hypothetical protein